MSRAELAAAAEMEEPLVSSGSKRRRRVDEENGFHGGEESKNGHVWMVCFCTFVAVCGSFVFGMCSGYSSPTESAIKKDLKLSTSEYSMFGSILTFGAMFGGVTSGPIADRIGRKLTMGFSGIISSAGWLAIALSEGAVCLDLGRVATGYGMGLFSYVVPVYIAEIAPRNIRGTLTSMNLVMVGSGISASFILGIIVSWRTLAFIGIVPCGILILGLFLIPDSPRWLAKKGDQKAFLSALKRLRGKNTDISKEAGDILDYIETLDQLPKAKFLDLFQKRYTCSLIIGIGLMVLQQFGGINGVCFYATEIFETIGFSSSVGTIAYGLLQTVVVTLAATVIDKVGRKPLLLLSTSGMFLGCSIVGLSFYMKAHEIAVESVPILAATGILLYAGIYAAGMGAIPYIIMSEIFPINIKGVAGSLAVLVNWFSAWVVSYTINDLMEWSSYGTFFLFGAVNALGFVFIISMVPETTGRTLEQIQASING